MSYIDRLAGRIGTKIGMEMSNDIDRSLLRMYAVIGYVTQGNPSRKHVHDAWSAWVSEFNPTHPSNVPFAMLTPEKQALDEPYARAIGEAYAELGLDL